MYGKAVKKQAPSCFVSPASLLAVQRVTPRASSRAKQMLAALMSGCGGDLNPRFSAADRPAAVVAEVAVVGAGVNALLQQIENQIIDAQRLRHVISRLRKVFSRLACEARNILRPVLP